MNLRLTLRLAILCTAALGAAATPALADDCAALGGVLGAGECQIQTNVGTKSGSFTIAETLHFLAAGKLTVGTSLTLNVTTGGTTVADFVMDKGSLIDGNATSGFGKAITINIARGAALIDGSNPNAIIRSNSKSGGPIEINAPLGLIVVNGLIESVGSVSGIGLNQPPGGGTITLRAGCELTVNEGGKVSSRGQDPGADLVHLEGGCKVHIAGLVESTGVGHALPSNPPNHCSAPGRPDHNSTSTACVEIWAGNELLIDGKGEVNADLGKGNRSWIDAFARGGISVLGPLATSSSPFAIHANNALTGNTKTAGDIRVMSLDLGVKATGKAIQADATASGSNGGTIAIEGNGGNIDLNGAIIFARGDFNAVGGFGLGGTISVRSRGTGNVTWTSGQGDVRPGTLANITISLCTGTFTGGATFNGAATQPVPNAGGCGATSIPLLSAGGYVVLPLCQCGPVNEPCPICDGSLTVDINVTVNFNTSPVTCTDGHVPADDSLCDYASFSQVGSAPEKWLVTFDLGLKKLIINKNVTITTTTVPAAGSAAAAPGIYIHACSLENNGTILVESRNKNAGPIILAIDNSILITGKVIDRVTGTLGLPGDITIKNCCGDITTTYGSIIETEGVDPGGSDINILACCGEGNISISGLVIAHAHAHVVGGPKPDIRVLAGNGNVTINSPAGVEPIRDDVTIAGAKFDLFAGLLSLVESGNDPGSVSVQASGDVTVRGHGNDPTGLISTSFAAVTAGTLTSNSTGGLVDVRALGGIISGDNRAFQSYGRIHDPAPTSLIQLWANTSVGLTRTGAAASFNPVVDSSGNISGGTNQIKAPAINIGANVLVTALVSPPGANQFFTGALVNGGSVTPAAIVSPAVGAPTPIWLSCEDPIFPAIPACNCVVPD